MEINLISLYALLCFKAFTFIMAEEDVIIHKEQYARIELPELGHVIIDKYTLTNKFMTAEVITYGSTITSIKVPDKDGNITDVVLGFDKINGYLREDNPYAGATVGRVANRITNGTFRIGNETFNITKNIGAHTLHGGLHGFDKKLWNSYIQSKTLVMTYQSKDMEEGFPGELLVEARYSLIDNQLVITFKAITNKPTPVNIVNHSYFNLAGMATQSSGLYEHFVQINADEYTPLSEELLPTGEIKKVESTVFDLREMKNLGDKIKKTPSNEGYDINFIIRGKGFRQVARLYHPPTGRYMEVSSDQPGVQFYTGNSLNGIQGRNNEVYGKHSALCFETQRYPDAVNHQGVFPDTILLPQNLYGHTVSFEFGVKKLEEFFPKN